MQKTHFYIPTRTQTQYIISDREAENKRRQKIWSKQAISGLSRQMATLYSATQRIISKSQKRIISKNVEIKEWGGTIYGI